MHTNSENDQTESMHSGVNCWLVVFKACFHVPGASNAVSVKPTIPEYKKINQ